MKFSCRLFIILITMINVIIIMSYFHNGALLLSTLAPCSALDFHKILTSYLRKLLLLFYQSNKTEFEILFSFWKYSYLKLYVYFCNFRWRHKVITTIIGYCLFTELLSGAFAISKLKFSSCQHWLRFLFHSFHSICMMRYHR